MGSEVVREDVEAGLWAIVRNELQGSTLKAAAQETGVNAKTLSAWKSSHQDRYQEIRLREAGKARARIAALNEDLAAIYSEAELQAAERLRDRIASGHMDDRDLALAVSNLSKAKGQAASSAMTLRGEATAVVEHRGSDEILRRLRQLMPKAFDGEAVEIKAGKE